MSSRKRKQPEATKQALVPPKSKYSIFENEYSIESIIQYMDYPELVELAKINPYYRKIIYFKHPGSPIHTITDISEYVSMFKQPVYMRISNSVNLRSLKLFLATPNKIKFLDLTEKEINANIFQDLNMDSIEELVIGKFPKDNSNQILSYFKKLKKLTYGENTYICPRESKMVPMHFKSFVIKDNKNYFKDCENNNINGLFEVINKGDKPYKYIGHVRNNRPAFSGMFYHPNGFIFCIQHNFDSTNRLHIINGTYSNSSKYIYYKCKTTFPDGTHFPCLNNLEWTITFDEGVYYKGKLFYGMAHDLTYESDISQFAQNCAKLFYPDGTIKFEGSFENGMRKKGKEYNKSGILVYDGTFVNQNYDGIGTFYYTNGFVYKGEFKENKLSGHGEIYDKDNNLIQKGLYSNNLLVQGDKYLDKKQKLSGRFENGNIVFGTLFQDDVIQFEGFFDKSEKPENGAIYFSGIKRYSGNILNNKSNGYGKSYNRDGSLFYCGEYSNGKPHGKGIMYKNSLVKFDGTFENNLRVGFFTITYNSGHIIKGHFENNNLHGKITIILASGKTFEGIFNHIKNNENQFYTFTNEQTGKTYTSLVTADEQIAMDNLFEQLEQDI